MSKNTQLLKTLVWLVSAVAAFGLQAKDANDHGGFAKTDKAYYLDTEAINFIRPGLKLTIMDVTIPDDRQPEVWFTITDPEGLPLDRDGITTPGSVSTSFILAYIPEGEEAYVAYTTRTQTSPITGDSVDQASTDSGGTYTTVATGEYIYKFATALPADYDTDATHTLGVYAVRDLSEFDLDEYVDNELKHFVPSGNSEPEPRDIVTTETCNGRCHDPLALHGGSRREVGLCVLCHNPTQGIDPDTGNSVFFPVMIHKIHMGSQLHNGYTIIGYRQGVHDYSDVEFPAPINDCETCHTGGTPTGDFPLVANPPVVQSCKRKGKGHTTFSWKYAKPVQIHVDSPTGKGLPNPGKEGSVTTGNWIKDGRTFYLVDMETGEPVQKLEMHTTVLGCEGAGDHRPGDFRGVAASDHTAWLMDPSRAACGACHDNVNFATGENHSDLNLVQEDDSQCHKCHQPSTGQEYDLSIRGAHTVEYKSNQLNGILLQVTKVDFTKPGQYPRVTFFLSDKNGPLNPNKLSRLRFSIAGPNTDYDYYVQEESLGSLVKVNRKWQYTFESPIPMDAKGSFSLGVEGRVDDVVLNPGTSREMTVEDQMQNFTVPFAVTDEEPVPRRTVVKDYNCEACHSNLSLHGGNRHNPEYCVTCHQPNASDEEQRTAATLPAQSIHFKYMIHKIHRGAELQNGYVVRGYRGSINDFSDVEFPGDLRNCAKCHVNDSYELPLPMGVLPTPTHYELLDPMEPIAAACVGCHDEDDLQIHFDAMTTDLGESCATCHGAGQDFAVEKVHAR